MTRYLSGGARVAGIVGWPVRHSLSPRIHGYWLDTLGVDGAYIPLPVPPDRLVDALRSLPSLGFSGCNITVPHKVEALAALDEISETAERVGAVNTVFVRNGKLAGDNTDVNGFLEGVREAVPDWSSRPGLPLVLGAGGAARAVVAGIRKVFDGEIVIVNRSLERAKGLAERFPPASVVPWDRIDRRLPEASLVVNTTTLGMEGLPPLPVDLAPVPGTAVIADIVYVPLETPLLREGRQRGLDTVDGLSMLLHQAVPGFEGWFGVRPRVDPGLRTCALEALEAS